MKYVEGFYTLASPSEPEPVLVHGYFCTDEGGQFVFGFNTHDGGGIVFAYDVPSTTIVQKVMVIKENT